MQYLDFAPVVEYGLQLYIIQEDTPQVPRC